MPDTFDCDRNTIRARTRSSVIAEAWQNHDAATLIATRKIIAALRKADLRMPLYGGPAVIVILAPKGHLATFATAARRVSARSDVSRLSAFLIGDKGRIRHEGRWSLDEEDIKAAILEDTHCWILTTDLDRVPGFARDMADGEIAIEPPAAEDVRMAARAMTRIAMPLDVAELYVPLGLEGIATSLKRGVPYRTALERMDRQLKVLKKRATPASGTLTTPGASAPVQPSLDDLHGLGEAAEWGRELATDLVDYRAGRIPWAEVDRGVLLSGPPGCGKTTFARALGKTCGVPVYVHSLAQWQATGYLNDLLKAMRAAFKEAQDNAPAILFIDELDSFGDRTKFVGHGARYCTEVVNGLLECLDGADRRDGVVVVGATNFPDSLDAAIRRAGRLDHHIDIPMPDEAARKGILAFHLRGTPLDLAAAAAASDGLSGADLEKAVRTARRFARRAGRPLTEADLLTALPPLIEYSPECHWRACVHEAGHALLARHYDMTAAISAPVKVAATAAHNPAHVSATPTTLRDDRRMVEEYVVTLLAGLAAEQIVFGRFGLGGGGDLRKATLLVATTHATTGASGRLTVLAEQDQASVLAALRRDALLSAAVEKTLQQHFATALDVLATHKPALLALAEAARAKEHLTTEEVAHILTAAATTVPERERRHKQVAQ